MREISCCLSIGIDEQRERKKATTSQRLSILFKLVSLQSLSAPQQEDLYEVICGRYETGSLIITSNRDLSEWGGVFDNSLIASAAMDRLVHRGIEVVIEGESYRIDQFKKSRVQKKRG